MMGKMIRCKGNTTMTNTRDGSVTVHLSMCNMTSSNGTVASPGVYYDSAGALRFTVTVVMVYGVAVIGVFALGLLNRKKRNQHHDFDKEAQIFMKDYEEVRRNFEQQSRVGAVSSLLHHIHRQPGDKPVAQPTAELFSNLAFLALPLSEIKEENETFGEQIPENVSNSVPSSVVIEDEFGISCLFCDSPLDKEDIVGPLCDTCVDKYKDATDFDDLEISDNVPLTHPEDFAIADYYKRRLGLTSSGSDVYTCSTELEEIPEPEVDELTEPEIEDRLVFDDDVFVCDIDEEFDDIINDLNQNHIRPSGHIWRK